MTPASFHELENFDAELFQKREHRRAVSGCRCGDTGVMSGAAINEHLGARPRNLEKIRGIGALDLDAPVGVGNPAADRPVRDPLAAPLADAGHRRLKLLFMKTHGFSQNIHARTSPT